MSQIAASPL